MRHFTVTVAAAVLAGMTLAGCSSSSSSGPAASSSSGAGSPASASASLSGSLTVFAAASLKEAFTTIGEQFEAAHPGVKVTFSFGASSSLAAQIINGAPA
ncbi:MAG: extracellular solute-binding protein, partial [Actinobacteria bacterium]|nr:extracellular solute-binding protein [Actinomycetota bacterium]